MDFFSIMRFDNATKFNYEFNKDPTNDPVRTLTTKKLSKTHFLAQPLFLSFLSFSEKDYDRFPDSFSKTHDNLVFDCNASVCVFDHLFAIIPF